MFCVNLRILHGHINLNQSHLDFPIKEAEVAVVGGGRAGGCSSVNNTPAIGALNTLKADGSPAELMR